MATPFHSSAPSFLNLTIALGMVNVPVSKASSIYHWEDSSLLKNPPFFEPKSLIVNSARFSPNSGNSTSKPFSAFTVMVYRIFSPIVTDVLSARASAETDSVISCTASPAAAGEIRIRIRKTAFSTYMISDPPLSHPEELVEFLCVRDVGTDIYMVYVDGAEELLPLILQT